MDQGEKIVSLAYELLQSAPVAENTSRHKVSFKMLCLATALAAIGGCVCTELADQTMRPINRYEKTELRALVFYAAKLKGIDETTLRDSVEQQFNVASFDDMTRSEFILARTYLQEKAQ